jgi:glycosyltransferase involved in cell wall biosynthesis
MPLAGEPSLVSVITPVLNAARFLDEAVASVREQSHSRWELLLVDDGSTDGSAAIAERWAALDPDRIRSLAHPARVSRGSSASRNLGLRHASGRYVALLDADDVWLPTHLAEQLALLEHHPEAGFGYGPTMEWYGWTGDAADASRDHVPDLRVPRERVLPQPGPLIDWIRRSAPSPCTCSVLVRRDVMEAVGGFEPAFPGMYDDQAFYTKLCLATPVIAGASATSRYRRHPDSCYSRAKASGRATQDRRLFIDWLDAYLVERGVTHPALLQAVRHERRAARHPAVARAAEWLARWRGGDR